MTTNTKQHIDSLTFNQLLKMYAELKKEIRLILVKEIDHKEELEYMKKLLKESFECHVIDSRGLARISDNELQLFVSNFLNIVMY